MYKNSSRPQYGRNQYSRGPAKRSRNNRRPSNKFGAQTIDSARFIKKAQPIEQTEYTPEHSFADFAINDRLKANLQNRGYNQPTQIQDQAIPVALTGADVVGIANTGTGKTAAFLLPLLNKLMNLRGQKALIIAPTRELALQIQQESRAFTANARVFDTLLIGGAPMHRQLRDLQRNPQVIIGTPGRIKDHLQRGTLRLSDVSTIVLDEVDRMLDMGFINDIRTILAELPAVHQSLFFSATMSTTIENLIKTFTHSPVTIMAKTAETSNNVEQSVIHYRQTSEKIDRLHELLTTDLVEKTLIFCQTKRATDRLHKELVERGFSSSTIHGNKSQSQRQRALKSFRDNHIDILVATDVAARGIDVDGITHVVNYEVPQTFDDYTHRIGRAGRGNNIGYAVTFVTQ